MSVVPKELLNKEFLSLFKTEEDVITVPRDRNGEFEPIVVPKHQSRGLSIERLVLSLYAKGMNVSDIEMRCAISIA
jgi:transposase-like protein